MSLRLEFVGLASQPEANFSALCRHFGVSRKTGYKWCARGDELADRSRRPHDSPGRTAASMEARVLSLRSEYPAWSARKLRRVLADQGVTGLPAASTFNAILLRHGCITPEASAAATPWQRFEHAAPNDLWQIDFKGHFAIAHGRCHPLNVIDDHSRYSVVLAACAGETFEEVKPHLIGAFQRYGLPLRISADNGSPWGTRARRDGLTRLGAWFIRLGIDLSHARVRHPQTNGKVERLNRTLDDELLLHCVLTDLPHATRAFDSFRHVYNHIRPHDALQLEVPASRFQPSPRTYPEQLLPIEYPAGLPIRRVNTSGRIDFKGTSYRVSKALRGERVVLAAHPEIDGRYEVRFCHVLMRTIDLKESPRDNENV